MNALFTAFAFVLGAVIGSFLNVVAFRLNTGMTLGGRSKCFSCNKTLYWYELIPVFSFIMQKGACRKCGSKISWQYPLVEIVTGLLFAMIFISFPPESVHASFNTLFYLFITCILVVIAVYDIRHKIIPDFLVYSFSALAFAKILVSPDLLLYIPPVMAILAGPLLALPFFLMWLFSKGTWMGLGDAKLVLGIGWTLGFLPAISAIILAFWIGAAISVVWMFLTFKRFKANYEIPFGPYLILGMYLVLFWGIKVIDISSLMY